MKKILIAIALFISLLVCFFLGSRMLFHGDFFYLSDQSRDFILTRDIVLTHKLTLIGSHSGLGGVFHGPLWIYMLVPIFLIWKGDPFTFTYMYALLPLVTVIVAYIVGSLLYDEFFGLLVAFLLAINQVLWGFINISIGVNVMPLLYVIFLYFSIRYIRGDQKALIFSAFCVGLAFQFETASAFALIPVLLVLSVLNPKIKPNLKILFYSSLSFLASLITFLLFDLRHHFLIFKSTLQLFSQNSGHKDYPNFSALLIDHTKAMRDTYLSVFFSIDNIIVLFTLILLGYFIFIIFKNNQKNSIRKEFLFLSLTPFLVYIIYLLYPHPIFGGYVLDLTVSLIFSLAIILITLWKESLGKLLVIIFLFLTIFSVRQYLSGTYTTPYISDTTSGSYLNQKHVVDWVFSDAKGKQFSYFVYTPETFTYGMDYLFWWESNTRHLPIVESKKSSITYLILYPPLANDLQAHAYWIEHTIHTNAKVLEKKIFTGNITVEKLDLSNDTQSVDPNYYQNLIFR